MVNGRRPLDLVFGALSDPTRRGLLEQLAAGESNVGRLAERHAMSAPAISKHLKVLERAGLIRRARQGREHRIRVDPRPIREARNWMATYATYWEQQFDAVQEYLDQKGRESGEEQT